MTPVQTIWAISCAFIIAVGQIAFKKAGMEVQSAGTWFSPRAVLTIFFALAIYAIATLLWINLLRFVNLNKAYSFMALCFIIVPIASHFIFHERITPGYAIGTALVVIGLVVATRFG
ncbi:4-amino-4-deoxy-L-arabinose-phospho-UDP flippase [Paraburkholderia strydomiana]|jgi:drug/metabolite transporter (DMT)-like permease|uniref:Drug/metabolite transporter (DMT)-like permease n=1 Tax=Paraburkholderia caledonica TaxID=134536 RepID=A0AB73I6B9_9BURK|nr:4-amino-4-deoxy-L-arabinose-phospho-UDP flippase [Paraburkholderia caledonica]MDP9644982.1 drug/metabolite transporter (DMT)-like permease [Paraburkholderia caledonica]MDR6374616.1 drug/metabolite transporter (DMT)-like permease [Paraburkholderia caledonica]